MKKCALILPYFGKFNNYFPLFLKSCGYNQAYDFFIFTDSTEPYNYPQNVHVVPMTLSEFRTNASQKLGFEPCITTAYKLCDFKPAYGFCLKNTFEIMNIGDTVIVISFSVILKRYYLLCWIRITTKFLPLVI